MALPALLFQSITNYVYSLSLFLSQVRAWYGKNRLPCVWYFSGTKDCNILFFKMRQAGNFQHENVFNDIFTCINALLVYTNFQNVSLVWILKWNVIYLLIRLWLRTISIWAIVLPKPILIGFLSLIRFEISNETSACSPGKYIVFKDFKLPLASFVTLLRGPKLLFSHKIAKPELDNHNHI